MAKEKFITSSIGKKIIVGLTGLFLISFLVVHVGINSTILINDNGETFNTAAHFMSHNWIIRVMEIGLLLGLLAHIGLTLRLHFENKAKRPVAYAVSAGNANSKWYSRSMSVLGLLLLIFLVLHMGDFWYHTKVAIFTGAEENSFLEVKEALTKWYIVVPYILGFIALGYHLLHGFPSAFQTLGLNHKKYTPIIAALGTAFSIVVPGLFGAIALAIFFGLVQ
ncbi:MAG: succinate dehydrogenase cytochrome b subunit [Chitinophagales bacterium]|nr:succinate dehydrogenase cytochrome b subunit [Chitinophagales bacterium]HMV15277.1 succinate dehydrogenase cytochrome b subunit [Chitinophagales bacterium]HMW11716.1 succinate dehydrogenase cytochrome b subunit [Chitinophagales bacterium]HMX59139.1 succinate dehydrogenase cytochrome b subunit [Chitinophagales bacterium]HMY23068.1 succinate dehydrogenase cytochrome b subunit [Chitinophagales bacterium]